MRRAIPPDLAQPHLPTGREWNSTRRSATCIWPPTTSPARSRRIAAALRELGPASTGGALPPAREARRAPSSGAATSNAALQPLARSARGRAARARSARSTPASPRASPTCSDRARRYRRGRRYALYAYRVLRDTDEHRTVGQIGVTLGLCCARLGRTHEAIEWLQSAAATFRRIDDAEGLVDRPQQPRPGLQEPPRMARGDAVPRAGAASSTSAPASTRACAATTRISASSAIASGSGISPRRTSASRSRSPARSVTSRARRWRCSRSACSAAAAASSSAPRSTSSARWRSPPRSGRTREQLLAREFLGELALDRGDPAAALALLAPALEEARAAGAARATWSPSSRPGWARAAPRRAVIEEAQAASAARRRARRAARRPHRAGDRRARPRAARSDARQRRGAGSQARSPRASASSSSARSTSWR